MPVVGGADYKQARQLETVSGARSVTVDAVLPGGETTRVIGPATVDLAEGLSYDIIAVGDVGGTGDRALAPLVVSDDGAREDADSVRLRVAHLASLPAVNAVDVYVTAPGDPLGEPLLADFTFKTVSDPVEVPAGDYQIRITAANDPTVAYDSGTVPLAAGSDLLVGAVNNTGFGDSPVSLIVESGGSVSEIFDTNAGAGVRVVHNSYNTPAMNNTGVDVYVNDQALAGAPAIANLEFPNAAPSAALGSYAALAAGDTRIDVTAAGVKSSAINATLPLANGVGYTVLAANEFAALQLLPYTDDNRSGATSARLRVIHGAGTAPNVDVYLTAVGAGIGNGEPVLSDVPFEAASDYLYVAEGDYDVIVTVAGTGTVAIGPATVSLASGSTYSVVARENADGSGFDVTLLDDFIIN
ncbi:MAG: DUF4397 domain-containing protein [Marinobacter sp.]|uniref:DUF4397 domain-containing protein n=1 Tax=Marinobacter sp. TaxID=50741 RepID=UPI00299E4AD7|nr:DUF4397 domain-containing protein [Marinobacter sp.]MDX1636136.1 DUF4397 domain-containing protein [Marinobacter sp.]